ncbi:TPA: replication-relaxation family protein, partial [Clostridioides difficile]|nr:replication-relaxation family protein [Clostridioides difficile]
KKTGGRFFIKNYKYTNFYSRDVDAFKALARVGHMQEQHFKNFNITKTRLKNYTRDKLVEKVPFIQRGEKNGIAYKLTKEGRKLVEKEFNIKPYSAQSAKHDLKIADKYCTLTQKEQDSVKTETEIRYRMVEEIGKLKEQDFKEADRWAEMWDNKQLSAPDMVYTTESGVEIAYEVITNNYGVEEIQAKENTITLLRAEGEMVKC